ncbi:MAG TPA: zinc metalloprotease HtpX [Mesorhizobium sp.]|jgi:heat shock protein HtpX|nr:zinc metalloprotease HtpX [Mesorhizobium sp.]
MTTAHLLQSEQGQRFRRRNTLHTWALGAGSVLILAVSAFVFAGFAGVAYAVVLGGFSMWGLRNATPDMVLKMYRAEPVARDRFPLGVEMVEELARRAGLARPPTLHVVRSRLMNAFAVGRRDNAAIAVTDGLVRHLTPRELLGVLAHEISHIAHDDLRVMAFADMVSRFTSFLSAAGTFSVLFNLVGVMGGYAAPIPWPAVLVLVFAPTIGGLLQLGLSRTREFDADLGAAMLTGDPEGLALALNRLERAQGRYWESLMLPTSRAPVPSVLRSHPPTAQRIARLAALADGRGAGFGEPPAMRVKRLPLVPQIRLPAEGPWGRGVFSPLTGDAWEDGTGACPDGLCPPAEKPRVRVRSGGVYW